MKHKWLILIVLQFILISGFAQDSIVDQDVQVNRQFWLDYNFISPISENKKLSTQVGFRKITPRIYNRILGISTLNITNNKKLLNTNSKNPFINSYHVGAGIIYTSNYSNNDNFELRLLQGVKFEIPTIKPVTLNNYIRFEQRFQNAFDNRKWRSAFRLRYRLSTV